MEAQYNESKMKLWLESSPLSVVAGFLLSLKPAGHGLEEKGFIWLILPDHNLLQGKPGHKLEQELETKKM